METVFISLQAKRIIEQEFAISLANVKSFTFSNGKYNAQFVAERICYYCKLTQDNAARIRQIIQQNQPLPL